MQYGQGTTDYLTQRVTIAEFVSKSTVLLGQATNVDNVSNIHLAETDMEDPTWKNFSLEVKITQGAGDESANDFELFWGFSSDSLGTLSPTRLSTNEFSLVCDLAAGTSIKYYMTPIIEPKARYMNTWYDCDNLTAALNTVDVTINKL